MIMKNVKNVKFKTKIPSAILNKQTLKIICEYNNFYVITRVSKKCFDDNLKKWFVNILKLCNHDINKFIWMIRRYPYEYIGEWKIFNETSSLKKEDFYSNLNMEDITS